MEPNQAQSNHPITADSLRRIQTTAREAMRLEDGRVTIVVGGTGSGKTTQVSRFILFDQWESGLLIACTQLRVIAATSVARRVAQELDMGLVDEVSYAVWLDNTSNDRTRLKFLMDGLVLQELRSDREPSRYAIGMRPDLKVVVMSATIDLTTFTRYFSGSNVFHAQGQAYPVQIQYLREATHDYRKAVLETVVHVAQTKPEGSILVFMTSVQEIEETCALIRKKVPGLQVFRLYSSLSRAQMEGVVDTNTGRKCIVSTSVTEASLTIDGITFAIDRERQIADH
ncbi:hypothetical protein LRP88_13385 [Fusarium phalaenopsidis]